MKNKNCVALLFFLWLVMSVGALLFIFDGSLLLSVFAWTVTVIATMVIMMGLMFMLVNVYRGIASWQGLLLRSLSHYEPVNRESYLTLMERLDRESLKAPWIDEWLWMEGEALKKHHMGLFNEGSLSDRDRALTLQ